MNLDPAQESLLAEISERRLAEKIAIDLAKLQGKRLVDKTRDRYTPKVAVKVREALEWEVDGRRIPKLQIRKALGSKSPAVIERYVPQDKN